MNKLSKLSSRQEIEREIHCFLLQKEGYFTIQSVYNEIIEFCEKGIDTNVVKNALIECMDCLLEDGLIKLFDNLYHSTLTEDFRDTPITLIL